jgi:hypothetical protein
MYANVIAVNAAAVTDVRKDKRLSIIFSIFGINSPRPCPPAYRA